MKNSNPTVKTNLTCVINAACDIAMKMAIQNYKEERQKKGGEKISEGSAIRLLMRKALKSEGLL